MKKGIIQGIGIFLGFFMSAAFAYVVSGTVKNWTTGETLTAADLNTTVQSLKSAIEGATQFSGAPIYYSTLGGNIYRGVISSTQTAAEVPTLMLRSGTIKNVRVAIANNNVNVACSVTLRKNGADTVISLAIPTGSTTTVTDADTISFVNGDTLSWRVNCPGAASGSLGGELEFEF